MMTNQQDFLLGDPDRRILRVLQKEGRITNQDLAVRVGMSPSACLERTRKLQERGIISGYAANLDPRAVGLPLLVFMEVMLERTTGDVFRKFAEAVRQHPEVLECHMVAGGFDYLLKLRLSDMQTYRDLLERLAMIPGVRETRSYPVIEEVKCETALSI
jgi:Lrp/AsnC family leucine-responsive transcriptional regulator